MLVKVLFLIFLMPFDFALSEEVTKNNKPIKLWQEQQLNCMHWCRTENRTCKENENFSKDRCRMLNEECTNTCLKINTQTPFSD